MTVAELMQQLQQFNPDTRVEINYEVYPADDYTHEYDDIAKVATRESTVTVFGPNHSRTTRQETTVVIVGEC